MSVINKFNKTGLIQATNKHVCYKPVQYKQV